MRTLLLAVALLLLLGCSKPPASPEAPTPPDAGKPGPTTSLNWQRYTTDDGVCSAEFPDTPKRDRQIAGGLETRGWKLSRHNDTVSYRIGVTELPNTPDRSDEVKLDSIRDNLPAAVPSSGVIELVEERKISEAGIPGRRLTYRADKDGFLLVLKVFIVKNQLYRLLAVVPVSLKDTDEMEHFLDSFRFERPRE
jgi:hypothetical protein